MSTQKDAKGVIRNKVLSRIGVAKSKGMTWREADAALGIHHHGRTTAALSTLHKQGRVSRLTEKRDGCSVYVLPEWEKGRPTQSQGRGSAPCKRPECEAMEKMYLSAAEELNRLRRELRIRGIDL